MTPEDLARRMVASHAPAPVESQLALTLALLDAYAGLDVLGEPMPALHRACPFASACWAGVPEAGRPSGVGRLDSGSEKGSIVLPWVGPNYRPGGICIVGMNLRFGGEDWELAMEHRIARDPNGGQEASLRAGKRAHGSRWATSTMKDAVALLRSGRGEASLESTSRDELADALLSVARVQAVKCSPIGGRSSPTATMAANCPGRFLSLELEVLRPRALLVYGGPAHQAVADWAQSVRAGTVLRPAAEHFARTVLSAPFGTVEAFLLAHPSHGYWFSAHRTLLLSLRARPYSPASKRLDHPTGGSQ